MSKLFNPLFDFTVKNSPPISVESGLIPLSPASNRAMEEVFCGGIPVFVDLENHIVLPSRD